MSTGAEQVKRLTITVSSGSGIGTVTPQWSLARWIRVHPVGESDTFDLTMKDGEGCLIISRTTQTGTFSEQLNISLGIVKTVNIANASQDGTYVCHFDCH